MQAPREASVVEMGDTPTSAQYHGVRWDGPKERWRAEITLRANGRVVLLGLFSDAVAAARAVDDAASVLVADGMVDRSTKRNLPHDTPPGGSKISPESLAAPAPVVADRRRMIKRSKVPKASASHERAPIEGPAGARANGAHRPNAAFASSPPPRARPREHDHGEIQGEDASSHRVAQSAIGRLVRVDASGPPRSAGSDGSASA